MKGGDDRKLSLKKWKEGRSDEIWVLSFNSTTIDKALRHIAKEGWSRRGICCHITLGYTRDISRRQAEKIRDILINKWTLWDWVSVVKDKNGTIKWVHRRPAKDL